MVGGARADPAETVGGRGPLTGPNPTDRATPGSKIHLITDRNGRLLSLGISGANRHDSLGLAPLGRGPRDPAHPLPTRTAPSVTGRAPRRQGIRLRPPAPIAPQEGHPHRIARKGIESSGRLGRQGRREDRVLTGRLPPPAPPLRAQELFLAFVGIAAVLLPSPSAQVIRPDRLRAVSGQHEDYAIASGGGSGE
ncbi:hypothetical protein GCM10010273_17210 [Streptomyces lavendulocolor]